MNEVTYYFCFQYLRLARTLRHYGYMQFSPAITDYPHPNCPVLIAAGNKELNFRIQVSKVIIVLTLCILETLRPPQKILNCFSGHFFQKQMQQGVFLFLFGQKTDAGTFFFETLNIF